MIIYAQIVRTNDGLPLSASTDFNNEVNRSIRDSKKFVKMLAYKSPQLPDQCVLQIGGVSFYLLTCLGVSYLVMADSSYPPPLAFCFLKELMTEFAQLYNSSRVSSAKRPYEFIDFDNFMNRTRQAFNKPQRLTTKINYADVELELRLRPPHQLSLNDIEPVRNGVHRPSSNAQLRVGPPPKLEAMSIFGWITVLMAALLILLGFYRGIISLQVSSLEEFDGPSPVHGFLYILESLLRIFQVYILLRNRKHRTVESWVCAVTLLLLIFALWDLRDPSQHMVFILSTLLTLSATHCRQLLPLLPDYHV